MFYAHTRTHITIGLSVDSVPFFYSVVVYYIRLSTDKRENINIIIGADTEVRPHTVRCDVSPNDI